MQTQDQIEQPESANAVGSGAVLGGVAAKKWDFLKERGAVAIQTRIVFEMPNGDDGTLDNFGKVEWRCVRPRILIREMDDECEDRRCVKCGALVKHSADALIDKVVEACGLCERCAKTSCENLAIEMQAPPNKDSAT